MKTLKGIFTPFYKLNAKNTAIMVVSQLLLLLIIWCSSTYKFLPTPFEVLRAFSSLQRESNLIAEIVTSFWLCIKSLFWSTIISCVIVYASKIPFLKYPAMLITKFRFLSMVGLSFFFMMLTSNSDGLKVAILTFSVTVFFTTSFVSVIDNIEECDYNHARTLGLNPWKTLFEVVIYGKLADLFDVMKQNFAMAWMMLTMVEGLVRSGGGIGVLLLNQQRTLSLDYIMALQITVLLIGIAMDYLIGVVADIICPYHKLSK